MTSEAEAATERSEGVAGAKRSRVPDNSPAGRALDTSGSESWAMPGGPKVHFTSLSHRLVTLYILLYPMIYW